MASYFNKCSRTVFKIPEIRLGFLKSFISRVWRNGLLQFLYGLYIIQNLKTAVLKPTLSLLASAYKCMITFLRFQSYYIFRQICFPHGWNNQQTQCKDIRSNNSQKLKTFFATVWKHRYYMHCCLRGWLNCTALMTQR